MLEIGVARGGSLQMWRQYLHPESVIVGIDIDPATERFDDSTQRLHVRIGRQQDTSFLQSVVSELGPFDVILDDGSHMTSHMVATFRYMFVKGLAPAGVYIVEDVAAKHWRPFRDSPMSRCMRTTK
ncbi:class I SAM-dependent methyltransferase [Mycobacterium sp. URHB0021]|jgi:23S rRNA U2552 (ribose-2'-O)-methylase RlmE/FtsJ